MEVVTLRDHLAKGLRCTGCRQSLSTVCDKCVAKRKRDRDYVRQTNKCWARADALGLPMGDPKRAETYRECMAEAGL